MFTKKVEIIGIGSIGLPLALLLAKNDVSVLGVDINEKLIQQINEGTYQLAEEKINDLLEDSVVKENFRVSLSPEESDIFVITVPTPIEHRRKIADLSPVKSAIKSILPYLKPGNLVIIESTIPPLTCREIVTPLIEKNTNYKVNKDIYVAHCPERILPGDIYNEIISNSRIVGGMNDFASNIAKEMYEVFVSGDIKITDDITAELCKLVENAYRDVNIAFANEVAQVAEGLNVIPDTLIQLANMHPRVNILNPGIGVGGHCIAVDPWFIKEIDDGNTGLIQLARRINDNRPAVMVHKIRKIISESRIEEPKILLLGAAYKPNVSDTRESPSLKIYDLLLEEGYKVVIRDPYAEEYKYTNIMEEIIDRNIIVISVKHNKVMNDIKLLEDRDDLTIIELP